jgi:hypothetical protein
VWDRLVTTLGAVADARVAAGRALSIDDALELAVT